MIPSMYGDRQIVEKQEQVRATTYAVLSLHLKTRLENASKIKKNEKVLKMFDRMAQLGKIKCSLLIQHL